MSRLYVPVLCRWWHPRRWLPAVTLLACALAWPLRHAQAEPLGLRTGNLVSLSEVTFFIAGTPDPQQPTELYPQLWRTDGTAAGTYPLLTCPATCNPRTEIVASSPTQVFFTAYDQSFDWQMWASDGTQEGTRRLTDLSPLAFPPGRAAVHWAAGLGRLFFAAEEVSGIGLWVSDGTAPGTRRIHLFSASTGVASYGYPEYDGAAFFFVSDPESSGIELWRSGGTAATTRRVTTLDASLPFSSPDLTVPLPNGLLFLVKGDPQLWRTDGSEAGTVPISAHQYVDPLGLEKLGDLAYFKGSGDTPGRQLWRSDGTPEGTYPLTALPPGNDSSDDLRFWPWKGGLLFAALHPDYGYELWISDGSEEGAQLLWDRCPGPCFYADEIVYTMQDRFYFISGFGDSRVLWVSDGTLAGSRKIGDVAFTSGFGDQRMLPLADKLIFVGSRDGYAPQLWAFDPETEATERLTYFPSSNPYFPTFEWSTLGDRLVFFADDSVHGRELWISDGTPAGTHLVGDLFQGGSGTPSCYSDRYSLCLHENRFRVTVRWHDQHNGGDGLGHAVPAEGSDRSGYFWFFREDNVELIVKVLDGRSVNGFYWSFYGALTDVEYDVSVVDTVTGEYRTYHNPPGEICGEGDTRSLQATPGEGAALTAADPPSVAATRLPGRLELPAEDALLASPRAAETCVPDAETLCLLDGRFRVRVAWQDQHNGGSGVGGALPYTDRTGFFWFFRPDNVELVVKALDGRAINGNFWLFYGALSDVGYTLTVEDLVDGQAVRRYVNPPGEICGRGDTVAFP